MQRFQKQHLSNFELITSLKNLRVSERKMQVEILALLVEMDARRLYADEGYSSLFAYCHKELGYAEGTTARLIHTARACAQHGLIFDYLLDGRLNPTGVGLLAAVLKDVEDPMPLLDAASTKSIREIEAIVASLRPAKPKPDTIRFVEAPTPIPNQVSGDLFSKPGDVPPAQQVMPLDHKKPQSNSSSAPSSEPATAEEPPRPRHQSKSVRAEIRFTCEQRLLAKLERAKELLSHKHPSGRLENIIEEALEALLQNRDLQRKASKPRARKTASKKSVTTKQKSSRYIAVESRSKSLQKAGAQCVYVSHNGKRCTERRFLEFDHTVPLAKGGRSDDPGNIRVLCRTHNRLMAERHFGRGFVADKIVEHSSMKLNV